MPLATVRLSHPRIEQHRQTTVYARIDLTGPVRAQTAERTPINLCLVIDRSGSMSGERIDNAKRAARMMVERLGPQDRISVLTFDDTVDVVVAARPVDDRLVIGERIDQIAVGGMTNLSAGVLAGLQQLRSAFLPNGANRMVLLSDGHANGGVTDHAELAALVSEGRADCSVAAIGIGADYDEALLSALTAAGDGDLSHAASADDVPGAIAEHGDDLAQISAQNAWLRFDPTSHVEITGVLGRDMYQWPLAVGDLYADVPRSVIVRLQVRPGDHAEGDLSLGSLQIGYTRLDDATAEVVEQVELATLVTADAGRVTSSIDRKVLDAAHLQLAAVAIRDAVDLARRGARAEAIARLDEATNEASADAADAAVRAMGTIRSRIAHDDVDEHLHKRTLAASSLARRSSSKTERMMMAADLSDDWLSRELQLDDQNEETKG